MGLGPVSAWTATSTPAPEVGRRRRGSWRLAVHRGRVLVGTASFTRRYQSTPGGRVSTLPHGRLD